MSALSFARLMTLGIGALRIPPSAFWAMSLPELLATLAPTREPDAPARADLDALMRRYPDRPSDTEMRHG